MARIRVKLREAMLAYKDRTGEKMTYKVLAEKTGLAAGTLHNMAASPNYNATLESITKICLALDVTPGDLLVLIKDPPQAKKTSRKKRSS